jgi:hypothetical protein
VNFFRPVLLLCAAQSGVQLLLMPFPSVCGLRERVSTAARALGFDVAGPAVMLPFASSRLA